MLCGTNIVFLPKVAIIFWQKNIKANKTPTTVDDWENI